MSHPSERRIALYACGDAGWMERFAVARHVAGCGDCRARAEVFRRDQERVREEAAALPAGLDWGRLKAEMSANIHLGLEAGECVSAAAPEKKVRPLRMSWRPVFAAGGLSLLLLAAMILNFPVEQRESLARGVKGIWARPGVAVAVDPEVALMSTRNGIEVRENGSAMAIMNPGTTAPVVMVNTAGSLRARYVDSDTGQVTITNVYAQ
jgi:hypothetical protein